LPQTNSKALSLRFSNVLRMRSFTSGQCRFPLSSVLGSSKVNAISVFEGLAANARLSDSNAGVKIRNCLRFILFKGKQWMYGDAISRLIQSKGTHGLEESGDRHYRWMET